MDTLIRIIIPISVFVVGVLVTLLLKRFELKRNSLRQHVEISSKLATDWYNQLHNLQLKVRDVTKKDEVALASLNYTQSREFLPSLQQTIVALKKHKNSQRLVNELEQFLGMVTERSNSNILSDRDRFDPAICRRAFDYDGYGLIIWNIQNEGFG
jgi:hypothetical protein